MQEKRCIEKALCQNPEENGDVMAPHDLVGHDNMDICGH